MLPTRGTCHGVFLLIHSARSGPRRSVNEWVSLAQSMPTIMAAAVDLQRLAAAMFDRGLAWIDGKVCLHENLSGIGNAATDEVLMRIAGAILRLDPPEWIHGAVGEGQFHPEFVPSSAFTALEWLHDDIEAVLVAAKAGASEDDGFRQWLGRVGESLVVAAERQVGASVRHVSLISDHFGYDIESFRPSRLRLEVKTSILGAEHRVFLTRNETNSAARCGNEWFLVQAVLAPEVLTASALMPSHVAFIRQLPSSCVLAVLPQDSNHCRWVETVELLTNDLSWEPYAPGRGIPCDWQMRGYKVR